MPAGKELARSAWLPLVALLAPAVCAELPALLLCWPWLALGKEPALLLELDDGKELALELLLELDDGKELELEDGDELELLDWELDDELLELDEGMLGMLLDELELEDEGIEGMLLEELWLADWHAASTRPRLPSRIIRGNRMSRLLIS